MRAVSFLIVFLAHAGLYSIVPGGFGVTVFFFLSGFLITTLLRQEVSETGTVSFGKFYLRRALRILPPFYLILGAAIVLTVVHVVPGALKPGPVLAQALHYSNYWFIEHGYEGVPDGTGVYWSLAVEEHFYLLFPMLYLAMNRGLSNRQQGWVLWALCGVICAWRCLLVFGGGVSVDRTYLASDTRFDSILFGCALATAMNPMLDPQRGRDALWKWVLFPAGLGLLVLTFVWREPWFRETLRYTVQGLALTPVFVTALRFPTWGPIRFLNWRFVARLGVLSYSLYLVHQVVLFATRTYLDAPGVLIGIVSLALSIVIALALNRFVERPCANIRKRLSRVRVTAAARFAAP